MWPLHYIRRTSNALSVLSFFFLLLLDALVKEKRWVVFKGEEDPTSVPGNWFLPNTTFCQFCIIRSISKYSVWAVEIWHSCLSIYIYIYIFLLYRHTSMHFNLDKYAHILTLALLFLVLPWCAPFDHCSWMDMLAQQAAQKGSNTRGTSRSIHLPLFNSLVCWFTFLITLVLKRKTKDVYFSTLLGKTVKMVDYFSITINLSNYHGLIFLNVDVILTTFFLILISNSQLRDIFCTLTNFSIPSGNDRIGSKAWTSPAKCCLYVSF